MNNTTFSVSQSSQSTTSVSSAPSSSPKTQNEMEMTIAHKIRVSRDGSEEIMEILAAERDSCAICYAAPRDAFLVPCGNEISRKFR